MWDAVSNLLTEGKLMAGVLLALLGFAGSSQALMVWLVKRTADALDGFRDEMRQHNNALTSVLTANAAQIAVMNKNADDLLDIARKCGGPTVIVQSAPKGGTSNAGT